MTRAVACTGFSATKKSLLKIATEKKQKEMGINVQKNKCENVKCSQKQYA